MAVLNLRPPGINYLIITSSAQEWEHKGVSLFVALPKIDNTRSHTHIALFQFHHQGLCKKWSGH